MPIYEYRCSHCSEIFEEWTKQIQDGEATHPCPSCNGEAHRLISNTSFALKGQGWYVTDYGSHKSATEKSADTPKSPAADKPAPASAKPAAATPAKPATTAAAKPAQPS